TKLPLLPWIKISHSVGMRGSILCFGLLSLLSCCQSVFTLMFYAEVPALGAVTYFVEFGEFESESYSSSICTVYSLNNEMKRESGLVSRYLKFAALPREEDDSLITIENSKFTISLSIETGLINQWTDKITNQTHTLQQEVTGIL